MTFSKRTLRATTPRQTLQFREIRGHPDLVTVEEAMALWKAAVDEEIQDREARKRLLRRVFL
ncbi:MAG TPA: hypothetical protein VK395_36535 [Gemmataceae bacterium]|nr:hypothetical protein [Gemmataceae bacterium]